jgi:CubicO group peptidase (beta-lactamase class C family)
MALTTAAASEAPGLEEQVDAVMKPLLDEDLISGSILIARDGRIEVAKGYGPANREHDVPCTADTKYRLASMTKSFTAMAIMMLEERGRLSVDDKLAKYLPDYPQGDKIKLHHLLTHTSGVVNYSALPDHYRVWAMPHTIDQVIARFRDEPLRFEPGTEFGYTTSSSPSG